MKTEPGGHNFTRDDVMYAVDHFLKDQNGTFYTERICLLHDRWTKCVNVGGGNDSFYLMTPITPPKIYEELYLSII